MTFYTKQLKPSTRAASNSMTSNIGYLAPVFIPTACSVCVSPLSLLEQLLKKYNCHVLKEIYKFKQGTNLEWALREVVERPVF